MNKVVHFEIPYGDKDRAMRFYSETFGWRLQDIPEMGYVMALSVDVDDQQRPAEAPSPVIYLQVDDLPAAIQQVEAAGGKVVTTFTPIPDMGAYARVADTEGNVIGLFQGQ